MKGKSWVFFLAYLKKMIYISLKDPTDFAEVME